MPTKEAATDLPRVWHPDEMNTELFCKHLNARHASGLPDGFTLSPVGLDEYTEECWRRWHERMHRLPFYDGKGFTVPSELDHTHREATGDV